MMFLGSKRPLFCLTALLIGSAPAALADGMPTFEVRIGDKGCAPLQLDVPATKVAFRIKNESKRALEWEILKDGMIVEERENILPGFSATLTANLKADSYEMTCGLLSNPKGKLIATAATDAPAADGAKVDLGPVIKDYKAYVAGEVNALVATTRVFTDAVRAGKLKAAQAAYAPARIHYERIEPIAEVFSDLDKSMDSRADDYEKREADPNFSGFHRLEYGLFEKKSTDGLADYADRLMADTLQLQSRIAKLVIEPKVLVGGAAELLEEVASKKISGEEERYSKADLSDFQANIDGAQVIVRLLREHLKDRDAALLTRLETNFGKVDRALAKYRRKDGFATYDALQPEDQKALKGPITVLAEDLSKLKGTLGLD